MLQLKRGGPARVQTEMLEFIALLFEFSGKLKILSFHVVVVQGRQRNSLLLRRFVFRVAEASAKRVTGDEPQGTMGRSRNAPGALRDDTS